MGIIEPEVNMLTVCRDNFQTEEDFRNAVKDALFVLLENDYITTVRYDARDKALGVIAFDYGHADRTFGTKYPNWLSPDEEEYLENMIEEAQSDDEEE